MTEAVDVFKKALKDSGYSSTTSRRIVFEALQGQEPMTMHELVDRCQGQVDRASIYRTTTLFQELGIIQRLQIGWKYKLELSDAFSHHHHHCSCVKCGRTFALPEDAALEARLLRLAKAAHFSPQDHQIEIRGLCESCQLASF